MSLLSIGLRANAAITADGYQQSAGRRVRGADNHLNSADVGWLFITNSTVTAVSSRLRSADVRSTADLEIFCQN